MIGLFVDSCPADSQALTPGSGPGQVLALSRSGTFAQHIVLGCPSELPRPLARVPLSLALSHGGERGFCPSLPFWMDVPSAEAPE